MIFSYENGLPFEINNPTVTNSTARITNLKTSFDNVPSAYDQRFKTFMKYIGNIVNTSTVGGDTYSPEINRTAVRAGLAYLFTYYHTYEVFNIENNGVINLTNSTTPRVVRTLDVTHGLPTYNWPGLSYPSGGLRAWRWPNYLKTSIRDLTNEGLWKNTQYDLQATYQMDAWADQIHKRLALGSSETDQDKARRFLNDVYSGSKARVQIVKMAEAYKASVGRPLTPAEFDDYSTPSRDKSLLFKFNEFFIIQEKIRLQSAKAILENPQWNIEWKPGHVLSLWQIFQRLLPNSPSHLSSNPEDSIERRWGEY
jgi:hypothetical protein